MFDAGVEEPDLLAADERARSRRRTERATRRPTATVIEPRLAARRARVEAEAETASGASRRRRRLAAVSVAGLVLAASGGLALLSPLASVRSIVVHGADRTGTDAVRAATGLEGRPPLVRVDEDRLAARVAALPWVWRAQVERRWPRTVVVSVEERQAAVVVPCQATSCLVDVTGRVLATATDAPKVAAGLPRLVGVPPAGGPGTDVPEGAVGPLAVAVALPEALRPLVLGIRGEGSEVSLDLQAPGRAASPPVVRLGPADRIPEKLTAAATVLARTSVKGLAVLDVRVPESPALTRLGR